jgi:serine/threonine-protein kinase
MLTGRLPFAGETAMSIAYKHLSDRVPAPSSQVPDIPAELDGFVASATERDRELRPESALEMRRDLESFLPGLPPAPPLATAVADAVEIRGEDGETTVRVGPSATTTATIPRVERRKKRRWRKVSGILLLVAALVASAWGGWTYLLPHAEDVPDVTGLTVADAQGQLTDLGFTVTVAPGTSSMKVDAGSVLRMDPPPGTSVDRGSTVTIVPSTGPPPRDVPDVTGRTLEKARKAIERAKLVPGEPTLEFSQDVPEGSVISQMPADGQAPQGSTVELVVSKGPPPRPVPDVVGRSVEDAQRILTDAGFVASVGQEKFSDEVSRGQVIRQSPAPAEKLQPGATITLVVSRGPRTFACPDFRGLSRDAASELADRYGLVLDFQTVVGTGGAIVYSQSPGPSVTVTYGDTITLFMV